MKPKSAPLAIIRDGRPLFLRPGSLLSGRPEYVEDAALEALWRAGQRGRETT